MVLEWALRWAITPLPGVRQREQRHVVALRRAVDEEPGAPGAPRLGGEVLRHLERRRVLAAVDAVGERRDVQRQRAVADRLAQAAGRRPGPPLWPGTCRRPGSRAA